MANIRPTPLQYLWLLLITAVAIAIHGYHPYIEDGEIYVPGIKQTLNPGLYPSNRQFFASHARLTLFPNLIAGSVRISHLSLDWALFLWHFASIFLLLLACWHLGRLCFNRGQAGWGGVLLVASLLTLPVAGTALYLMDQYVNTRSLSTPAVLFMIINVIERKFVRAGLWAAFCALIHPLMVVFGVSFILVMLCLQSALQARPGNAFLLLPVALFPPVSAAYREVLASHSYFFVLRWEWYEWVGLIAPILLLWWMQRMAGTKDCPVLRLLCRSAIIFAALWFAAGLLVSIPWFTRFAELQPMRSLHPLYILLFVFAGGLLAEFWLQNRASRWLALLIPLGAGMFYAQRQLFPATSHLELPDTNSGNPWVQAFLWSRDHTPAGAYFALNPDYMEAPGEDQHGFRAIAERSRLADRVKDSGAVSMFPALAETWRQQVQAEAGWQNFRGDDFHRLKHDFGVTWVIWDQPTSPGLNCTYHNNSVAVCRID